MTDNTKILVCFSNYYRSSIYSKFPQEYLDFLKFLKEKDLLNSDWKYEKVEENEIYEF